MYIDIGVWICGYYCNISKCIYYIQYTVDDNLYTYVYVYLYGLPTLADHRMPPERDQS